MQKVYELIESRILESKKYIDDFEKQIETALECDEPIDTFDESIIYEQDRIMILSNLLTDIKQLNNDL